MQYILSQEEFDAWVEKSEQVTKTARQVLLNLCTQVAENMPISLDWGPWKYSPTPWGCVRTRTADYCDECPVKDVCPAVKKWSK